MQTTHETEIFFNESLSKSEVNEIMYGIYKLKLSRYEQHISKLCNIEDIELFENKIKRLQHAWSDFNRTGKGGNISITLKHNNAALSLN